MNIVIPGSEIPEWFSHQSVGAKVYMKVPSHLYNDCIGMAVCAVYCHMNWNGCILFWSLIVKGNQKNLGQLPSYIDIQKKLLDHLWLIYVTPEIFNEELMISVWECDANGFCQIGIRFKPTDDNVEVKKCRFCMVYKKNIEDLIETTAQCSNNSIIPYEGLDVPHHNFYNLTVVAEGKKVKQSCNDYDGAGPSGEGSSNDAPHPKRIERLLEFMDLGNSDGEESSEFKECDEELGDWQKSSESDLEG
jgi:hypothetical protein